MLRKIFCPLVAFAMAISSAGHLAQAVEKGKRHNRLINEKSPYLLKHAENPIDWYPWGDEAFERAKKEDRPIFLSIGYSTCHWCNVMEEESFSDPEVAKLLNETFISIKVDREERPDIDNVYMAVCLMLTGSGGWPLTILMTPDKKPFYAGTYFPKHERFGRIGLMELIPRVQDLWQNKRDDVLRSADSITSALASSAVQPAGDELGLEVLRKAYAELASRFDEEHGGFGEAPKFPTPHNLYFLLRYWQRTGEKKPLLMVEKTLREMRRGGIYDHLGFGFHRYSTDAEWLVPHFEKMLYDQALLALAYLEAYQATGRQEYAEVARELFTYVLRDMTAPEGGFYSAESADSEGEEGKFYFWTEDEIKKVLSKEDADFASAVFNVRAEGNFVDMLKGEKTGENILHLRKSMDELAEEFHMSAPDFLARLDDVRQKLLKGREGRVHPDRDDKVLTDWNGLMIAALARGARALGEKQYERAAAKAADFILTQMRDEEGRLLHRWRHGSSGIRAKVDDYAFFLWGLIELYEAGFAPRYLEAAIMLNQDFLRSFWDEAGGGFYFTSSYGEPMIVRMKEIYDGAVPSANSVAMLNLLRLGRLTADAALEEKASRISAAFSKKVGESPSTYTMLLSALDFGVGPSYEIVIVGNSGAEDTEAMLEELGRHFLPRKVVVFVPADEKKPKLLQYAEYADGMSMKGGKATAYVCTNYNCKLPTNNVLEMLKLLGTPLENKLDTRHKSK